MQQPEGIVSAPSASVTDDTDIPELTDLHITSESQHLASNNTDNTVGDNSRVTVDDDADIIVEADAGSTDDMGIIKKDVVLPKTASKKLAFVLYNVFTKKECEKYIQKTEKMGYEQALVNVGGGRQRMMTDVRNNTRCIWDSNEEAARLWERIKTYVPDTWRGRTVMGLNERLRFLRYDPGEYFLPHMDGVYQRDNGEQSHLTIMLYLNEGYEGGSTTFLDAWGNDTDRVELVPKTGCVLVFQHDIMHEGSILKSGIKYAMRTDVMYSATTATRK